MPDTSREMGLEQWAERNTTSHIISDIWEPVLLYRDGMPRGFGSYIVGARSQGAIVTTASMFVQGESHRWLFRRLRPASEVLETILAARQVPSSESADVALCLAGSGMPPEIEGFYVIPEPERRANGKGSSFMLHEFYTLTSLVTGETVRCPALYTLGLSLYLIGDMQVASEESGTGFVCHGRPELYILKGWAELTDAERILCGLDFSRKTAALFSRVTPL